MQSTVLTINHTFFLHPLSHKETEGVMAAQDNETYQGKYC